MSSCCNSSEKMALSRRAWEEQAGRSITDEFVGLAATDRDATRGPCLDVAPGDSDLIVGVDRAADGVRQRTARALRQHVRYVIKTSAWIHRSGAVDRRRPELNLRAT